jgi:hypothetical protein
MNPGFVPVQTRYLCVTDARTGRTYGLLESTAAAIGCCVARLAGREWTLDPFANGEGPGRAFERDRALHRARRRSTRQPR